MSPNTASANVRFLGAKVCQSGALDQRIDSAGTPVSRLGGVERQYARMLRQPGIHTVLQLSRRLCMSTPAMHNEHTTPRPAASPSDEVEQILPRLGHDPAMQIQHRLDGQGAPAQPPKQAMLHPRPPPGKHFVRANLHPCLQSQGIAITPLPRQTSRRGPLDCEVVDAPVLRWKRHPLLNQRPHALHGIPKNRILNRAVRVHKAPPRRTIA